MKASDYGIKNLKRIVAKLPEWTRQPNDQYEDRMECGEVLLVSMDVIRIMY